MPKPPSFQEPLFVGVDGGGTKCRVVLTDCTMKVLGRSTGGPANPHQNQIQAEQTITLSIGDAFKNAGISPSQQHKAFLGIGLAGVDVDSTLQAVKSWDLICQQFFVTTDLQIANLAAHESENGAVILVGNGSSGFTSAGGENLTIGGHGFPQSDKGSGAWMGFCAVQRVLLAMDGMSPPTQLTSLLEDHLRTSGLDLASHFKSAKQRDYAALAPLVLEAANEADLVANDIVEEGATYLSHVAEKLFDAGAQRMSLIGDLAQKVLPYIKPRVQSRLQPALNPPEIGAVFFARQQYFAQQPKKTAAEKCVVMYRSNNGTPSSLQCNEL